MEILRGKRALINMKCSNEESFKCAVTRFLNPSTGDSGRVTKILKLQSENYNWDGIDFPTPLNQIKTFEKNNDLLVNVFGYDKGRGCVTSLKLAEGEHTGRILILFVDNHYTVVKSMSRLFCKQATRGKTKGKRLYCNNCLQPFLSEVFNNHVKTFCLPFKIRPSDYCVTRKGDICVLKVKWPLS